MSLAYSKMHERSSQDKNSVKCSKQQPGVLVLVLPSYVEKHCYGNQCGEQDTLVTRSWSLYLCRRMPKYSSSICVPDSTKIVKPSTLSLASAGSVEVYKWGDNPAWATLRHPGLEDNPAQDQAAQPACGYTERRHTQSGFAHWGMMESYGSPASWMTPHHQAKH